MPLRHPPFTRWIATLPIGRTGAITTKRAGWCWRIAIPPPTPSIRGSKLHGKERTDFFDWLFDYEYRLLELPKPDLVIYLDVPVDQTERNMHRREIQTGTAADIHERDDGAISEPAGWAAGEAAERFDWTRIACTKDGAMRSIDEIHEDVYRAVKEVLG